MQPFKPPAVVSATLTSCQPLSREPEAIAGHFPLMRGRLSELSRTSGFVAAAPAPKPQTLAAERKTKAFRLFSDTLEKAVFSSVLCLTRVLLPVPQ